MKKIITMQVVVKEDGEAMLAFILEDDVVSLRLDGNEICRFDWEDNFKKIIKQCLKEWK